LDKLLIAPNWRLGLEVLNNSEVYKYLPGLGLIDLSDLAEDFQFKRSEEAWAWLALQFDGFDIKEWKVSNDFMKTVNAIVTAYHEPRWDLENIYHYGLEIAQLADHLKVGQGQVLDVARPAELDAQLQIHHKSEIVIKGADLIKAGHPPGPALGQLLSDIEKQIVCKQLINQKKEILDYVKKLS
jgi:tRNA nucleotidyltransferase (CCA-adding enzyme)